MDRLTKSIICHEWGHALIAYLLLGGAKSIQSIEFVDTFVGIQGHTNLFREKPPTKRQEIMILFGGMAAEKICGFTKVLTHRGTDANRLSALVPNKQERKQAGEAVIELLMPYKNSLEWLVTTTLEYFPTERDQNGYIYYRISKEELSNWIATATASPVLPLY